MLLDRTPFADKRSSAERLHRQTIANIDADEKLIAGVVDAFVAYPLMPVSIRTISTAGAYGIKLESVLEAICKRRHWQYVAITENYASISIVVPNPGSNRPLVAPFLLLANSEDKFASATVEARPRSWHITLQRPDQKEILDAWINACRTDKVMQGLLGFGPIFD